MDKIEIGHRISAARKEQGMTQKELAEKLNVTDKSVSKWETGTHFPDIAIMEDLAIALGISIVELLGLENASTEEAIAEMTAISLDEKEKLVKELRYRGWSTVIRGLIVFVALIYASKVLADNGLYGMPQIATMGMLGVTGTIVSDGIFSISNAKKFLK